MLDNAEMSIMSWNADHAGSLRNDDRIVGVTFASKRFTKEALKMAQQCRI